VSSNLPIYGTRLASIWFKEGAISSKLSPLVLSDIYVFIFQVLDGGGR